MKTTLYILLLILATALHGQDEVVDIDSRRELFVDHFMIEKLDGVELKIHEPRDAGKVLAFDKPWEGPFCGAVTIIKDDSVYRMYYSGRPSIVNVEHTTTTCYAESEDGILWRKPDLGIHEVMGTYDNNVIFAGVGWYGNFSPFLDTREGIDPSMRYKALGGDLALVPSASKDGIHWDFIQEKPVFEYGHFDSQNVAFWSEEEQCYLCYFRDWIRVDGKKYRTVSRTTSKDFINWTDPVEMDFGDTPHEQIYTQQTHPYFRAPHIYISLAARLQEGKKVLTDEEAEALGVHPAQSNDCSDLVLMSSRGGNRYYRTFLESFIRPGMGKHNWTSRSNYPALNVVQTGSEEMSVYVRKDYTQVTAHVRRYTLRLDGFVSVHAPYKGGEMITRPFRFTGDTLRLNYATSAAGSLRVELQSPEGEALEGFELENSVEIVGDELLKAVSWKCNPDLSTLSGQPVRLRFVMKDADLYSLKFE